MTLADLRWERERQRAHAAGLLTTSQAARRMGVPEHMVRTWAKLGLITNRGAGGKGSVALWDYAEVRTAPARRLNLRARGGCTQPGCGELHHSNGYCQRHYNRWRQRSGLKRGIPSSPTKNADWTLRNGGGLNPPRSLPYRALAVSCPECGDLRTTPDHLIRRDSHHLPPCPRCSVMRSVRYIRQRIKTDDEFRRRQHQLADRRRAITQAATVETATNRGKMWTGPELEIAARDDLSASQVAAMLGRTLYAVKHIRRLLKTDPRKVRLASVSTQVGR